MNPKGWIALDQDGKPVLDDYGWVLWFKTKDEAKLVGLEKVKPLVRAKVPRQRKAKPD